MSELPIIPTAASLEMVRTANPVGSLPELRRAMTFDVYWHGNAAEPIILFPTMNGVPGDTESLLKSGRFARFRNVRQLCRALKPTSYIVCRDYLTLGLEMMPDGQLAKLRRWGAQHRVTVEDIASFYSRVK
jgi:hypothetical protein